MIVQGGEAGGETLMRDDVSPTEPVERVLRTAVVDGIMGTQPYEAAVRALSDDELCIALRLETRRRGLIILRREARRRQVGCA